MLSRADNALGQIQVNKGTLNGLPLIAWDAVERCSGSDCRLFTHCPYEKKAKCELQMKYLVNVHNTLAPALERAKDPVKVMRCGLQMIPLYHHLVRFKMYAFDRSVTYTTAKGDVKVRGIFKEIRETIKVLEMLHKSIFEEVKSPEGGGGEGGGSDIPQPGDLATAMFATEGVFAEEPKVKPILKRKK